MADLLVGGIVPGVQMEGDATIEVSGSLETALNGFKGVIGISIEDGTVVEPAQLGAMQFGITAGNLVGHGGSSTEDLRELLAMLPDSQFQFFRERINHGCAHAVQTTGSFVGSLGK